MHATWAAAGLVVLAVLAYVAGVVDFGLAVWIVLAVALASAVALDVARRR